MRIFTLMLLLATSTLLHAESCQELIAQLPKNSPETNTQAKNVSDFIDNCKKRPGAEDPQVLNDCVAVGMRAMGSVGNYVAQQSIAKIECEKGNDKISKYWLGMMIQNNNATPEEREIAQKAIDSNKMPNY